MNSFDELCKKLTQDVANTIVQGRSWNEAEQFRTVMTLYDSL